MLTWLRSRMLLVGVITVFTLVSGAFASGFFVGKRFEQSRRVQALEQDLAAARMAEAEERLRRVAESVRLRDERSVFEGRLEEVNDALTLALVREGNPGNNYSREWVLRLNALARGVQDERSADGASGGLP